MEMCLAHLLPQPRGDTGEDSRCCHPTSSIDLVCLGWILSPVEEGCASYPFQMSFSQPRPEIAPVSAVGFNTCAPHGAAVLLPGCARAPHHPEHPESGAGGRQRESFAGRGATALGTSKRADWSAPAQPCLLSGWAWHIPKEWCLWAARCPPGRLPAANSRSHIKGRMSKATLKGLEKVKGWLGCSQGAQGGY